MYPHNAIVTSQAVEREIVEKYLQGHSAQELKNFYGYKTAKSITDKVKKFGYDPVAIRLKFENKKPHRQFSLATIDSVEKAYILGVIITDGCIDTKANKIEIDSVDEDMISFISTIVGKDYKTYYPSKYNIKSTIKRRQPIHRIVFHNPQLITELSRFGVVDKKSKIIQPPSFQEGEYNFLPYVIRGIIDGNGWIRKDGQEFYICSASYNFIIWIKNMLETRLYMQDINITQNTTVLENGKNSNLWYARTSLHKNIQLLKYIVYDRPFGMQRKYNKMYNI